MDIRITSRLMRDYSVMREEVRKDLEAISANRANGQSPEGRVINFIEHQGFQVEKLLKDLWELLSGIVDDLRFMQQREAAERDAAERLTPRSYQAYLHACEEEMERYRAGMHRFEKVINRHRKGLTKWSNMRNKLHHLIAGGAGIALMPMGGIAVLGGLVVAVWGLYSYYHATERVEIAAFDHHRALIKKLKAKKYLFDRWAGMPASSGKRFSFLR